MAITPTVLEILNYHGYCLMGKPGVHDETPEKDLEVLSLVTFNEYDYTEKHRDGFYYIAIRGKMPRSVGPDEIKNWQRD